MRLRLTKIDEYQFLTCVQRGLWGSKSARFKDWQTGDYLVFIVDKNIAGLAEVDGKPFFSTDIVWDNGIYPHRIRIKFINVIRPDQRPPILGEIRDVLTAEWGPKYGWGILNQRLIEGKDAETIVGSIRARPNDLEEYRAHLEAYIEEAKVGRERRVRRKRKGPKPPHEPEVPPTEEPEEESRGTREPEETTHTQAQGELIRLGKITGCSVWIAPNDQKKLFRGKPLGEGCLERLPNLGLSEEATRRIALIDVIWIRQNAPVCAFEVETTTSIYSGLLRMSDLLSVVPAIKLRLYLIAPEERQDKVMRELARPTFRKIGLSDYCRYVSTEGLNKLIARVEGFGGHVKPTVIDTIATELPEQEDDLETP